ncbi:hypothetical protein [Acidithiobacillus sulfuriphilus]|uniref:hypothetical protein n=1 Tax=Acidithiobacillus sulfuriphilus TaxID=1867749 RepID=UPI003F5D9824
MQDGRDDWVAAYFAWYHHFLAMQPRADHIATSWAREMAEASLVEFHQRPDQNEIRLAATTRPAPPARQSPMRDSHVQQKTRSFKETHPTDVPTSADSEQMTLL